MEIQLRRCGVLFIALMLLGGNSAVAWAQEPTTTSVSSPDGQLTARVWLRETADGRAEVVYDIQFNGQPALLPSALGVELADGVSLGSQSTIERVESRQIDTRLLQFPGKRRVVEDRCTELTVSFVERGERVRQWQLVVRAYDDGVALRYRFPTQPGWQQLEVASERTEFVFSPAASAVYLPLDGFVSSHEALYQRRPIEDIPTDQLLDVPLLVEVPDVGWLAVAEANLVNYAGLGLSRASGSTLVTKLSPRVDQPAIAVRAPLPAESPWRVIQVAADPLRLIESDLLLKLNAPTAIDDTTWIKPGKTTFPWWNGYFEEDIPFEPGLNTELAKHYIDFCAEYGIPYHSLDGMGNTAWYGVPIMPYGGGDPTAAIKGLNLPEVLDCAKRKGVGIRLWMHWQAAQAHLERAFPLYRQWGVEGVMIDFMDRNDQEMIHFQQQLLQLATDNHLTVTFHGVAAPTGLQRTYPNLLTSEAVMSLEYNKWSEQAIPPQHDVTVPFTRMLAGPLDYHQGSLRTISPDEFQPREAAPLVIGTPCRTLASYVVLQNHLSMMADYPTAYRRHPLTKVIARVPTTWDDTRAVAGKVGEFVVVARQAGDEWWIGAMTDRSARKLSLPLDFLGAGSYLAEVYQDNPGPHGYARSDFQVSGTSTLDLSLTEAGGALVRLSPAPSDPPGWKLVWSDDFDELDHEKWHIGDAFLAPASDAASFDPNLVSVTDGVLVLEASNDLSRFGRVVSKFAQQQGRWEVRARIPSAAPVRSTIRLLPDAQWPSRGEIDIMTSDGSQPHVTTSEFHWGSHKPLFRDARSIPQRASEGGRLVAFPDGFHTFAVEWTPDQLRFYVDDLYHTVFYDDEIGYFLPKLTEPMYLAIDMQRNGDTAAPDATALGPARLLVDWVRIYVPDPQPTPRRFVNGSFENRGGSLTGWHIYANRITGEPNVSPSWQHSRDGHWSLALSGQSSGGDSYAGVSQGISVSPGQTVRASLSARIDAESHLADTDNRVTMKIEFYRQLGHWFGGPEMIEFREITIADRSTPVNAWQEHVLELPAPADAVEARLSLVFAQSGNQSGTVYIDDVQFSATDQ